MLNHATYHAARANGPVRRPSSARRITLAVRAAQRREQRNGRRDVQRGR